ncbi:MAG TPA: hypothetical protein VGR18_02350 [Rubrobacter sp.]|nr:hypothetical protein [Rubrobacter sp.]
MRHSRFYTAAGQTSSSVEKQEKKAGAEYADRTETPRPTRGPTTQPGNPAEGGVTVGEAIARAELEPAGGSGTSGTAVLKEVGDLGVQVELDVSGLPTGAPDAAYYAQVHEGSCSDERGDEGHEREEHGAGPGPALAFVGLDRPAGKVPGLEAHGGHEHGGHEHGIPEAPSGSLEQPVSFGASADGTSSVTSLLENVEARRLTSGGPEYVHLHAVGSEDAPELACGDLVGTSRQRLG